VISHGEIILVEDKDELMRKLGRKQLTLQLEDRLPGVPPELAGYGLQLSEDGCELSYVYDTQAERTGILALLERLNQSGIRFKDLSTTESSLEDIFVGLLKDRR